MLNVELPALSLGPAGALARRPVSDSQACMNSWSFLEASEGRTRFG
jgi:hypothetical protein